MKIKSINLNHKQSTIRIPEIGDFADGVNIIYSPQNNSGKTTFSRSLVGSFFSKSMPLPIQVESLGELESTQIEFEENGKKLSLYTNGSEIVLSSAGSNDISFGNNNDLLENIFGYFPKTEEFKASLAGSYFYLDQDLEQDSKILWPSLWKEKDKLNKVKLWLTEDYKDINFNAFSDMIGDYKKQLKNIENKIETLKEFEKSDMTSDSEYDTDEIKERIRKIKLAKSEYKRTLNKINENESHIFQLKQLVSTSTSVKKAETVFINAIDAKTKQKIIAMVNFEDVFNFSREPLTNLSSDAKAKISEINKEQFSLKKKLETLSISSKTEEFKAAPVFDYDEILEARKKIMEKIEAEISSKKMYAEANAKTFRDIKTMNSKLSNSFQEVRSIFEQFDSKSGTDLFINKVTNFLIVVQDIKALDFPIVIDSIKEKDISDDNLDALLKKIEGISNASKKQFFITLTSPSKRITSNFENTELKKQG